MTRIVTKTEKQTFNLGKRLARGFKGGEVVALIGDLGSGKTVFTKGIAEGLGIKKHITSPTFVLLKSYAVKGGKNVPLFSNKKAGLSQAIKKLVHIDAYRLNNGKELDAIGATEFFDRNDCVTIIEWADRVKEVLPKDATTVNFNINGKERNITIK